MTDISKLSAGFRKFCSYIVQDLDLVLPHTKDWPKFAFSHLSVPEKKEALADIDRLLDGRFTPEQLSMLWNASEADFLFPPHAAVRFLQYARDVGRQSSASS